jgi:hypothetical protein
VNPFLRLVACLTVLGASFGAGLLVFAAAAPRPVLAQTDATEIPSLTCKLKAWLRLDRDCASRSEPRPEGGPVVVGGTSNPAAPPSPPNVAAAKPPAPAPSAGLPREALQPTALMPPEREVTARLPAEQPPAEQPAAQPPVQAQPAAQQQPTPTQPSIAARPQPRRSLARHATERRTTEPPKARAAIEEPEPRAPAKKKVARREPIVKRPAAEALRTVRKFDDRLQDIPVDAYAADGSRRSIVIHPRSIQDVYYYSVPR